MRKTAKIIRKGSRVVAILGTPNGDITKAFPESEFRQERRRAMCWIEKTGREVWGGRWQFIEKLYEA